MVLGRFLSVVTEAHNSIYFKVVENTIEKAGFLLIELLIT